METQKVKQFLDLDEQTLSNVIGGDNESYDAFYKFGKWVGKTTNDIGKAICKHAPWC
ncbi:hypothetical protein [Streptococcus suis]|uniref:hypothetical protein n=1 Tax=Streptococcus suis TaxID=1307 RepID=UPI0004204B14|nr:hypothetical protein [Streptococcus suis]HEM3195795.1 hypothetical protein [Streptococcus suis 10581]MBM7154432.1 hypothetical protein [Streptococcus suis]MBM7180752.1 hypothetical protein [Streptococcus suis]MBO3643362.1 hypothetical protein [Streptococcus suis]MBY4978359.1 hypothetical protein [Streptococcus suis]